MSILGNQTLLNNSTAFYLTYAPSVTKSLPGYSIPTGIINGNSSVVYQLPVDGSNPNAENLSPGYYFYTLTIYLTNITWSTTTGGNLIFVMDYTENSVLIARRRFRCYVNAEDDTDPNVSFTIGIPMTNPSNYGNIAIEVFNKTGADIAGGYIVTINQYNLTKITDDVSVISL